MRLAAFALLFIVGCSEDRTPSSAGGVHPEGWTDRASEAFHAKWIAANGFPLARCQQCHGDDYAGGAVGVGCAQASCHSEAPTACTTCHGANGTPRPSTGAHWAHQAFCSSCHHVPAQTTDEVVRHASGDAGTIIEFSGLAVADAGTDAAPGWDATSQRCTSTYCHGAASPAWTSGTQVRCDGCHEAPPKNHARWSRVAASIASCANCHPAPSSSTHVNGQVDVTVTDCTTCHGSNGHPNPPVALDGSTQPSARGVGAHARHLDATLSDRIGKPLICNDCHVVPATVLQAGHLDGPQTQVRFPFGGTYDASTASCTVWCHFDKAPGPVWTDASGSARKCDACHEFPPRATRSGTPHPSVPGELSACLRCHPFSPSTHVDGVVEFLP